MKRIAIILLGIMLALAGTAQTFREMMDNPEEYNFYDIQASAEAHFAVVGKEQGSGYKQYMRWEMFTRARLNENGRPANWAERSIEAYRDYVQSDYFQNLPTEKSHNGYWTELGPTNWVNQSSNVAGNGRINVLAFHPTNTNIMWAGSALGGLWRTDDAGATWTSLTDGMPNLGVSGIVVHPTNTNIIYMLTGDGDGSYARSTGVLKTTDGGITWKTTGLVFTSTSIAQGPQTNLPWYNVRGYKLIIHPTEPNTLLAATTSGVYRTTNGGNDWTDVSSGLTTDLAFRPGVPSTVYSTGNFGFRRSTDGGVTWASIESGLPFADWTRIAIGVTPANNQIVYLLIGGGSTGFRGLYRSTNAGTDFTVQSNSPNIFSGQQDGSGTGHQAGYDIAIAISPTDANLIYMGGINIWRSTNGGSNWVVQTNWRADSAPFGKYVHADIHHLSYRGTTLWVGCDGGVFRTTVPAASSPTWENRSNGLGIMQFYKIGLGPSAQYGGTQDCGTNRLSSVNTTATAILGADGFECIATPLTLFASTQNGLFRRGINSTGNWTEITPPGVSSPWNVDYILRPGTVNTLFYGGTGGNILRSTDSGDSWTNLGGLLSGRIFSLAMSLNNTNRLYFASATSVRRTDNAMATAGSITYTTINTGLPTAQSRSGIAVDPNNSSNVAVCISGYGSGQKVYQSTNAGGTWTNISGTLPNVPIHCILHDGINGGLYIGSDIGVFYRNNSTGGWLPFMNGLPTTIVTDLEIQSGFIYAGTFGRGMWRSAVFSNCAPSLTLTSLNDMSNYGGYQYYTASNTISSTRTITGGVGTDVTYRAGGSVTLNEGFEVRLDNEFGAELGGCNSVFQPIIPAGQGILEIFSTTADELSVADGRGSIPISYDALMRMPTRVYPNPFSQSFTLEVAAFDHDRSVHGELYDLSGRRVKAISTQMVPQGQRLVLEVYTDELPAGVYMLRVFENEMTETFKVVKQ